MILTIFLASLSILGNMKELNKIIEYSKTGMSSLYAEFEENYDTSNGVIVYKGHVTIKDSNLRLEYISPEYILVISNPETTMYFNPTRGKPIFIPTKNTFASVLLAKSSKTLAKDKRIQGISLKNNILTITAKLTASELDYDMAKILFKYDPTVLIGWDIRDKNGYWAMLRISFLVNPEEIEDSIFDMSDYAFM